MDKGQEKNTLDMEHVQSVCKIGQGNSCCRYLVAGSGGFECAKHSSLKSTLDERVSQKSMVARGDNCEGVLNPGY